MKTRSIILLFVLLLVYTNGFTQSLCKEPVPSYMKMAECSDVVRAEILAFNKMAVHYGIKDTIRYECVADELVVSYKEEILNDWKYDPQMCGEKLMLRYGKNQTGFQLLASIPIGNGKSQVYEVIKSKKGKDRIIFKSYKEQGVQPSGDYLERNCAGQILVKGKYRLVNTPSTYSYNLYDDDVKKHLVKQVEGKKTSVKKGVWKYYDENGKLLYEENYAKKLKNSVSTTDLCDDLSQNVEWNYYKTDGKISPAIALFNAVNASLGRNRYLSYEITHRKINYYLNGQLIADPFFKMNGKYKPWVHQVKNHGNNLLLEYKKDKQLSAYIPAEKGKDVGEVLVFKHKTYGFEPTVTIFQMENFYPNGAFEKRNCRGEVLLNGYYSSKDTSIITREKAFDPNTYEEIWVEDTIDQITVRSGKWEYYDDNGALVLEENYPGEMKWAFSGDLLCTTLMEEARKITEPVYNPFMNFNAINDQLGLNNWLSQDDILEKTTYYLNGQLIGKPDNISKTNYRDDYRFQTPNTVIELYTNTRIQGATSVKQIKRKWNYTTVFAYDDGKKVKLSFVKDKLKREELKNGQRNGVYEERLCDGRLITIGQYTQVDTFYRDTVVTMNMETYEEQIQITEYKKAQKKCGRWKYYDTKGVLVKEEKYGTCE